MDVLSNQCQCKIVFAACKFCQNMSFRQIEMKPIVYSLPFCFYVRLHIFWYWKELSQVTIIINRFEISFGGSILYNHTNRMIIQGVMMFQKRGTPKDTIYGAPYWVDKEYMVLFSTDFKYNLDPFNLYIIDNYVKRTIGRWYRELSNLLHGNH